MRIKFKVNFESSKNEWVGWFGEDVMKLKLASTKENFSQDLLEFINKDLGIKMEDMEVTRIEENSRLVEIEFPDIAWELFLSAIEK